MSDKNNEMKAFLEAAPDTRYIEILAPDMNVILRGKRAEASDFDKIFDGGINYCASSVVMDSKGGAFERIEYGEEDGDPDVIGHGVPGTLAPIPWFENNMGQVLLYLTEPDGSPVFLDPRAVLQNSLQPLTEMGLHPVIATELEFYLIEHDGHEFKPRMARIPGSDLPQDGLQFANMDDLVEVDAFLNELARVCDLQKIPVGAALSEFAPGQFEVNLHHVDNPALACDHAVLLKRAVKAVARQHDLAASFMAKPFSDFAGCGMHVHISLLDDEGNNVFAGKCADGAFSDTLRYAIGGMAAAMPESMAVFAHNANSYRRYCKKAYVPTTPNWGPNHRDLAMRIPLSSEKNTRVEHRVAGSDCNPYLAVAAILAGIHHGIENKVDPGTMVQAREPVDDKITLPVRWELALDEFDKGKILPTYFGAEYHRVFGSCRREECDQVHSEIPDKDFEWYLRAV
jgi:glutamine synthetase